MSGRPVRRRARRASSAREIDLRARKARLLVLDLDGVLTDGRITVDARGREARVFHEADRTAIGLLRRAGIEVLALASDRPRARPAWARTLGLVAVLAGGGRGLESVRRYCGRRRLPLDAVVYVGHDVLELPLAGAVGLAINVSDGAAQARRESHWVIGLRGGSGIVRAVAERVLRAQGKWASTIGEIWRDWD